jgi:hypothetical protein
MSFVAAAVGVSAATGLASAFIGSHAAQSAANTQAQSAQNALDFQKTVFNTNQSNLAPYLSAGSGALGTINRLNSGDFTPFTLSPDYQFALSQGTRGVTNYENSQGMGLSGGALKDIAQFNQGLATQNYGNYYNRLLGLAQLGGNTAAGLANTNTTAASGIGNTTMGVGQAQASGVIGSANAWMSGLNGVGNNAILAAALKGNPSGYQSNNSITLPQAQWTNG